MKETVDSHTVEIEAAVMQITGMCRYESIAECRRIYTDELICASALEGDCCRRRN